MKPDFLETWLSHYETAPYNLGESGVSAVSVDEVLAIRDTWRELGQLSLENSSPYGSSQLRAAVADLYPAAVTPETVLVTTGVTEAILVYYHANYREGANVVVPSMAFHVLRDVAEEVGYEVRTLALRREHGFRPQIDELSRLVDRRTTAIVMNTPHNPTGVVLSEAEVHAMLELASSVGADLLVDEHYRLLPHDTPWQPMPSFAMRSAAAVGLGSAGKCFGSVGLRVGWLIGRPAVVEACRHFKDLTTHTVCPVSDLLATEMLRAAETFGSRFQGWVRRNMAKLAEVIEGSDALDWMPPTAGTIAFPFLRADGENSTAFARELVKQTGVLVLPGEAFGQPDGFRVNLGVRPEVFHEAMHRLERFVRGRR